MVEPVLTTGAVFLAFAPAILPIIIEYLKNHKREKKQEEMAKIIQANNKELLAEVKYLRQAVQIGVMRFFDSLHSDKELEMKMLNALAGTCATGQQPNMHSYAKRLAESSDPAKYVKISGPLEDDILSLLINGPNTAIITPGNMKIMNTKFNEVDIKDFRLREGVKDLLRQTKDDIKCLVKKKFTGEEKDFELTEALKSVAHETKAELKFLIKMKFSAIIDS